MHMHERNAEKKRPNGLAFAVLEQLKADTR